MHQERDEEEFECRATARAAWLACRTRSSKRVKPAFAADFMIAVLALGAMPAWTSAEGSDCMSERSQSKPIEICAAGPNEVTEPTRATLAGGCFWGMQEILRQLPGVLKTTVGYTGGTTHEPTYEQVKTGRTGHAEAVLVEFDPARISYAELLRTFFRMHDPTTKNRQQNDVGSQYRSAIFVHSEEQRKVAEEVLSAESQSGRWNKPIVTEIVPAGPFTPAEDYHQDYLQKNPLGYTCHFLRD